MNRHIAPLLALALLAPFPAAAHHAPPAAQPDPDAQPTVAVVSNPCTLGTRFLTLHADIVRIGLEAIDMGNTARHLHHSSLARPYKHIEDEWRDVKDNSEPVLDSLSDIPLSVDLADDSTSKQAALALSAAYQNALEQFISYTSSALYYEHSENLNRVTNYRRGYLNFGTQTDFLRPQYDNVARNQLEGKLTLAQETLLSLRLPEHRYSKLCHVSFSHVTLQAPAL